MERKGEQWSGLRHEGLRLPGRGPGQCREPRLTAAVRSPAVRLPSIEVAPPLNPRLWAAGPRPSARASFRAHSRHPLFPARLAGALGPLQGPALGGRGRPPSAGPLTRPEPPPAHPAWVLLSARWAASPLAGRLAEAAALTPEPPLWQAPHSGLASLLALHPHLDRLLPPRWPFIHPSLLQCLRSRPERKGPRPRRTKPKESES